MARLSRHALWDSLLICVPPVLALLAAIFLFAKFAWFGSTAAMAIGIVAISIGVFAVLLRYRPMIPKPARAAQMIDERAGAKDHFLTLATIDPAQCPESLHARLRRETDQFADRVELKHDFPYQPKRSAFWSVSVSLIVALLVYFLLPVVVPMLNPPSVQQQLRELAEKIAQAPRLKELSQQLKALAAKLDDPKLQPDEKQAAVQELEKKITEQQKQEQEKDNQNMLAQAQDKLKGSERQQSVGGQDQQKDQQKGGGNLQTNLPKESGQGEGKQSQGEGGESKGETSAQLSKDMKQGNSAQSNPNEPGQDKNQQRPGDAKGNQPDPNQPGKEQNTNKLDKNQGGTKDGAGKNQASEEPPQGAPPAERFYQAGEGKDGVKNARYVTVQLPEDAAADSKGEGRMTKESKSGRARPLPPMSNAPLPAQVPNAPTEKQQMPIEYRGIIR
jgi:F0F1-type ATP synthase membrane subunit b/b'